MKDTKMTIESIQAQIDGWASLILKKKGLIKNREENGEDTSQLKRDIEDLTRKIKSAEIKIEKLKN